MSVANFEGVVQYRLLGSHPAASGRYYTTGFAGNSISVREFVERLIKEHRINVTRYKLEIKKMPTDKESEKGSIQEELLGANDIIYSYNRLAVTISQRQVGESFILSSENSLQERKEGNSSRGYNHEYLPIAELELIHYTEESRSYSMQDNSLTHSSVDLQLLNCSNANGNGNNSIYDAMNNTSVDSRNTNNDELLTRHNSINKPLSPSAIHLPVEPISTTRARAAEHDNHALERIATVAGKVLPVKSREHITLESSANMRTSNHICVLCDLPPFQPRRTTCCHYIVCNMCWLTAQNMMPHDGDCPVCGAETLQTSLSRNSKRARNVETNSTYNNTNNNNYNYNNRESSERTKRGEEYVKDEQIEEKFDSKFTHDVHDKESEYVTDVNTFVSGDNGGGKRTEKTNTNLQATGLLQINEQNNKSIQMQKNSFSNTLNLMEITPEVVAFERQLRLNLDKTLSFLDLCDIDRKEQGAHFRTNDNIKSKRHILSSEQHVLNSKRSVALRRADALFLLESRH